MITHLLGGAFLMYPSIWQILIVLLILLLLFGHRRIKELGKALGESLRDFKKGLEDDPHHQESIRSKPHASSSASLVTKQNPKEEGATTDNAHAKKTKLSKD